MCHWLRKTCFSILLPRETDKRGGGEGQGEGRESVSVTQWPLTTLWQILLAIQLSVPTYRHASLKRPAGCQSTNVMSAKHVTVFSKTTIKRFGAAQIESWVRIHVVLFTSLEVGS